MILIDGYNGGVAHITADQIRDHNIALYGSGDYVLPVGNELGYEIVDNNTITIASGMVVMNGARAIIGYGNTDTAVITNGTSGYKRTDIIVAEYSKDDETLVESVTLKVVKGTIGSSYSDPTLVTGNIRAGASKRQMALYRVKINGLAIESVEQMWEPASIAVTINDSTMSQIINAGQVPVNSGLDASLQAIVRLHNAQQNLISGTKRYAKLWENASPTSNFAAQTISLSLSNYDGVRIIWAPSTTGSERISTDIPIGAQYLYNFFANGNANKTVEIRTRNVEVKTSGCVFAAGYAKSITNSTTYTNNGDNIPLEIYGIIDNE